MATRPVTKGDQGQSRRFSSTVIMLIGSVMADEGGFRPRSLRPVRLSVLQRGPMAVIRRRQGTSVGRGLGANAGVRPI